MSLAGKPPDTARRPRPIILVFGEAGGGKTYGCLTWPDAYYIDTESGASLPAYTTKLPEANGLYFGAEDGAHDLDRILQEVRTLACVEHDRKTLVIDSLTRPWLAAIQQEYDRITATGRQPRFGEERKPAIATMRRLVTWLFRCDMNVILVAHEKPVWSEGEEVGRTYDAWDKLRYELSLVCRIVQLGDEVKALVVKSRYDDLEIGSVCDWSVSSFESTFTTIHDDSSSNVELAGDDQLEELSRLYREHGPCEWREKWFERAGVENWEEMPRDILQSCLKMWKERKELEQ